MAAIFIFVLFGTFVMSKFRFFIFLILFLLLCISKASAQARIIDIYNADKLLGVVVNKQQVQKLIGRVALHHDGAIMYCDSALLYDDKNTVEAFGHIHIRQGDTLSLYGDKMIYDGNAKIASISGNVRLIDPQITLNTHKLTYDRNTEMAYYDDHATTLSKSEELNSRKGYYYVKTKEFAFKGNVVIKNPEYTLYSDTLIQNTTTDISYFKGPSTIVSKDSYIYCENGWYDKRNDICQFNKNSFVTSGSNILRGDSLYYERKRGYGKGIGHVTVKDTVEKITVTGHFAETFKNIERYMVTDSATMMKEFEKDTLYLHADTLLSVQDSLNKRVINAYYHVKFFKPDMQGLCDSLSYTQRDSTMQMFRSPILWNEQNQITASHIDICIGQQEIYYMLIRSNALIISEVDSVMFNQLGGVNMTAYFRNNELHQIDVFENSRSYYYPSEENGDVIGLNEVSCKDMVIYVEGQEVSKIVFKTEPVGTMHPIEKIDPVSFRLNGFSWQIHHRPMRREDIYIWN